QHAISHDALAADLAVGHIAVRHDVAAGPDATVLVYDGALNDRPGADPHPRLAVVTARESFGRLVVIGAHDDRIANGDVAPDLASQPYHTVLDPCSRLDNASIGDQALFDLRPIHACRWEEPGAGIDGRI